VAKFPERKQKRAEVSTVSDEIPDVFIKKSGNWPVPTARTGEQGKRKIMGGGTVWGPMAGSSRCDDRTPQRGVPTTKLHHYRFCACLDTQVFEWYNVTSVHRRWGWVVDKDNYAVSLSA
jgi:hypothetical protein